MWLSITAFMALTYCCVHLFGLICAVITLRNHPWMLAFSLPFIGMLIIGPAIFGAITSAVIAWPIAVANKSISLFECLLTGAFQTFIIVVISFTRILATL